MVIRKYNATGHVIKSYHEMWLCISALMYVSGIVLAIAMYINQNYKFIYPSLIWSLCGFIFWWDLINY